MVKIVELGAGMDEQRKSSSRIVDHLIQRAGIIPSVGLDIQKELVTEGKNLDDTAAGIELLGGLYHLRQHHREQLATIRRDLQEASRICDEESTRQLQDLKSEFVRNIPEVERQQEALKTSMAQMHDAEMKTLRERLHAIEAQQRVTLAEKQQELHDMKSLLRLMREQLAIHDARWEAVFASTKHEAEELDTELQMGRIQSEVDGVRKKKHDLDLPTVRTQKHIYRKKNIESEQSVADLKRQVMQLERQLNMVSETKNAVKGGVNVDIVNSATTAATTVLLSACESTRLRGIDII